MLSIAQKRLLHRAAREAALDDSEYRDALELVSGCRSSKDRAMTDRHFDLVLGYFEAIHWRKVDAGELQPPCSPTAVFKVRNYWASRNPSQNTSRDRFRQNTIEREIAEFESALAALGFGSNYCQAIRARAVEGRRDPHSQFLYRAALRRTLAAKERKVAA
ncbi:MAG: hypothetical protein WBW41_09145 [Verrucomicrobiia bacterium]